MFALPSGNERVLTFPSEVLLCEQIETGLPLSLANVMLFEATTYQYARRHGSRFLDLPLA